MANAHIASILPIKDRVLAVDQHTSFLAHYDLNEHDVLRGVSAIGSSVAPLFGDTKFVSKGAQYEIYNQLTLSAWIYPTATPSSDRGCILIGKGAGGYYLTLNNGMALSAYWHSKTPAGYHSSTGTCPINTWTHVAAVWSDSELKLYLNGKLDSTFAVTGTGARVDYVEMGIESAGSRPFAGKIRELGIWAGSKTEEQIKRIMNGAVAQEERGLRAFWKMDEGQGTVLRDSSPFHGDVVLDAGRSLQWSTGNSIFTLRPKEGKFGGAIAVEESTVNEITSFRGEFESLSIGGTLEKIYGTPTGGNATVRYTRLGRHRWRMDFVTDCPGKMQIGLTNEMTWNVEKTLSYDIIDYHLAPSSTGSFSITRVAYGNTYANTIGKNIITYTPTEGSWQGTTEVGFRTSWLDDVVVKAGSFVIWENTQVEAKPMATSFVEGSRAGGNLSYDAEVLGVSPTKDWTISGWFKQNKKVTGWSALFTLGRYYKENESEFQVWSNHSGQMKMFSHDNKSGRSLTIINAPNPGELEEWFYLAVTHVAATDTYTAYVWTRDRYEKVSRVITHSNPIAPELGVGCWKDAGNVHVFNGLIDEFRVDKVARTDEEILAWYQSNSPFWPRGIYRKPY